MCTATIKISLVTLTALLKSKISYRIQMPEINACDFSISYIYRDCLRDFRHSANIRVTVFIN
jgi:hypothetical protein